MQLIVNTVTRPAFNLALEEYILSRTELEAVLLWRNEPSVIVGRNQNAVEEIDAEYARKHDIAVVRRISGGGAVFHDLGNVNYTVIGALKEDAFGDYRRFAAPVCEFLGELGVSAEPSGRNDITIHGAKCSGNAQAVIGGRIMHHGTILFDADISRLAGVLRPSAAKIESKGVKSVRARVTNVAEHLALPMSAAEFFGRLCDFFRARTDGEYILSNDDIAATKRLAEEKYGSWEWSFGHSPAYGYRRAQRFPAGTVELYLSVGQGIIRKARIFGDFFGIREVSELEARLAGVRHEEESIRAALRETDLNHYIYGVTTEQLLTLF